MAGPLAAFMIVSAAVGVARSLWGGASASRTARNNAIAAQAMGRYNAINAIKGAAFNTAFRMGTDVLNATLAQATTSVQAALIMREAQYNAALQFANGMYNAALIDRDAELRWRDHELNMAIFKRKLSKDLGTIQMSYAASGIEVSNVGDAPSLKGMDIRTEGMLQMTIMKYGVDVDLYKLYGAAAGERWKASADAAAIIYRAENQAGGVVMQGQIENFGMLMNSRINAAADMFQGTMISNGILYEAGWASKQFDQAGRQAFMDGLFSAGSSIVQAVGGYYAQTMPMDSQYTSMFEGYGGPQSVFNPSGFSSSTTGPSLPPLRTPWGGR